MKIGYARVSTTDQSIYMQKQSLRQCQCGGCEKIFSDTASDVRENRSGLYSSQMKFRVLY